MSFEKNRNRHPERNEVKRNEAEGSDEENELSQNSYSSTAETEQTMIL